MYLSRIILDLHHPSVRQALRDCNDMHRNLMQAFPEHQVNVCARRQGGILYRLVDRRSDVSLLLISESFPDRQALAAQGFMLSSNSPKDISALQQVFSNGRILRFELLASPCKKQAGDGKNSRRVFLRTEQERAQWLVRKADQSGFEVLEVSEHSNSLSVDGNKGDMHIHFEAIRFDGVLKIVDADRFWKAYCEGIGPGKSYGLGMLSVARA